MSDGLRTAWELLGWIMAPKWNGIPIAALGELAIGGGLLLLMFRATTPGARAARASRALVVRRPGWLARWRAQRGIVHPPRDGWVVGYSSAIRTVRLTARELGLGGLLFGAPGSGKTTGIRGAIQAAAAAGMGAVIIDPKRSPELRQLVWALGGRVWTIGGAEVWNPLEADPEVMAEQLLESEPEDRAAPRVFREGARLAARQLGRALIQAGETPDVHRVAHLLRSGEWETLAQERLGPRYAPLTEHERDGVQTFAAGLTGLLLGPAGRSLGSGQGSWRLQEVLARGQLVLFSLDGKYPDTSRRIAGWVFLSLLAQLSDRQDRPARACLVAVDEAHRLGWTGRLAVDLLATGRQAGVPVILSSQGPSDLDELGRHLLERAAQDAAWILAFRQGTLDSDRAARLLGVHQVEERTWSQGRQHDWETVRLVEKPRVPASALEALQPGDGQLWVPGVDGRPPRTEPVRVAQPVPIGPGPKPLPALPAPAPAPRDDDA